MSSAPTQDILNVVDDLAKAVAREFGIRLTSLQQAALSQPRSLNPEAFDAYMKGYYFFKGATATKIPILLRRILNGQLASIPDMR